MTKANECTCPSGDGSLRHPCPAHIGPFDKLFGSPVHNESEPDLPPLDEHLAQVFETGMALSESVEQAGGDERAVDGKPRATRCPHCGESDLMPGDLCTCGYETDPAAGYACSECDGSGDGYVGEVCRECDGSGWFVTPEQARAALAQPSPVLPPFAEKVLTKLRRFNDCAEDFESGGVDIGRHWLDLLTQLGLLNRVQRSPALWEISQQGEDLLGTPQPSPASDLDPFNLAPHAEAFNEAPAEALKPEQAEAERPEVASLTADLYEIAERILEIAEGRPKAISTTLMAPVRDYRLKDAKAVARVMGERLVALADRYVHHDRVVGALRFERQQMDRAFTACINERDAANARLHEVATACATAEQGRDAALARVAELEAKLSDPTAVHQWQFSNAWFDGSEEVVLKAGKEGSPIRTLYAAPVAQAQRSVPEEFSFEYRHPNGECHTVTVSREQVINEMPDFLFEALCSKFCNCEPVGETNVVECRCDEYAEEFKLIAAAPGKEGV
ncbi:hypothetical protein [Pseudomonas aeruginosa]|uniref:hypothetical protein n=1 Tax=Pseudomonas aeruginosa TaxID=287 RepID=UPI00155A976C|nr:hypothetical protein [Pseudomonas aeruginosa]